MVIKLDVRYFLHDRPRMLTHDLFAAVNILVVYYAPPPSYGGIMH